MTCKVSVSNRKRLTMQINAKALGFIPSKAIKTDRQTEGYKNYWLLALKSFRNLWHKSTKITRAGDWEHLAVAVTSRGKWP